MADSSPPLLRALSVVRASLFAWLSPRDVLSLLATCKTLRSDAETVALAFESHPVASHLYRGCSRDWCAPSPTFDPGSACDGRDVPRTPAPTGCRLVVPGGRFSPAARLARRVGLLSLAEFMETQLKGVLYSVHVTPLHEYSLRPFILPLGRLDLVKANDPEPGLVSGVGYHWDTFVAAQNVSCRFCDSIEPAIEQFIAETEEYHNARQDELEDLEEKWRHEGYDDDSQEFEARASAFEDARSDSGTKYNHNYLDASQAEVAVHLCEYDLLPHLDVFGEDADAVEALAEASESAFTDIVCPRALLPLARFFRSSGFPACVVDARRATARRQMLPKSNWSAAPRPTGSLPACILPKWRSDGPCRTSGSDSGWRSRSHWH